MLNERYKKFAKNLVEYSVNIQPNEYCLINTIDVPDDFVCEIVDNVWKRGGIPIVKTSSSKINYHLTPNYNKQVIETITNLNIPLWQQVQAAIVVDGSKNPFNGKNIPSNVRQLMSTISSKKHHEIWDRNNVKWALLNYPNELSAFNAKMSNEEFENFYLDVCLVDYAKMKKAMEPLKKLMESTDKVHIISKNTDLTLSIKGQKACICAGEFNIPDGEVFTSPIKNSVNGFVTYNVPCAVSGEIFENIKFVIKNGKIVESSCTNDQILNQLLDTDEGSRYFGEFALGVNPYIKQPMYDILFDEKISGSFHMAFGTCLPEAPNGNASGIHIDLIQIQTPEKGGGEIWFDDVLIRKDGKFVLDELKPLNPENLLWTVMLNFKIVFWNLMQNCVLPQKFL